MSYTFLFVGVGVVALIVNCTADLSGYEYADFKKSSVTDFHKFSSSRALETERLTTGQVGGAALDMEATMVPSLTIMTNYLRQELDTAMMMMEGTNAQGCVAGIASHMDNEVSQALDSYKDCSYDIKSRNARQYNSLMKEITNYEETYKKTLAGMDNCKKTYPNSGSISRLKLCVDSWSNKYFTEATKSLYNTTRSPSMAQFLSIVGECVEMAANKVIYEGWRFIGLLSRCSKLSDNIDSDSYESQLIMGYSKSLPNIDLINQTLEAQNEYSKKETEVEIEMMRYNGLQKSAYMKYILAPRNESYYVSQLSIYLKKYSSAMTATASDNPALSSCSSIAQQALAEVIRLGSQEALKIDTKIENQTRTLLQVVDNELTTLNMYRQIYGNPAILSCFSQGYIYAEKLIKRCFYLSISDISIKISEANETIAKNMDVLKENVRLFSNSTSVSSGSYMMDTMKLEADRIMYGLQRCLYQESGTKYEVTTPYDTTTTEYGVTTSPVTDKRSKNVTHV